MPRIKIIYNPSSGREAMIHALPQIIDLFSANNFDVSCHQTSSQEMDIENAASEAAQQGFDYVAACGGDGTVNKVIQGLASQPQRPVLGIIPAGTVNDLATALNLPKNLLAAAQAIIDNKPIPIDLGQVNNNFFINISGCGMLTDVSYIVPAKVKTVLGQFAYYLKGLEEIPRLSPISLKIEAENLFFDDKALLFLVCNSTSVGGFKKLAPKASLFDGLLDIMIIKNVSLPRLMKLAPLLLTGQHLQDDCVIYHQTPYVKISGDPNIIINLDGEMGFGLPAEYKVLPQHLLVAASPASTGKKNDLKTLTRNFPLFNHLLNDKRQEN